MRDFTTSILKHKGTLRKLQIDGIQWIDGEPSALGWFYGELSKAPHLELRAIASLCNYLCNDVRDDYLGIIHGIPHPDSDGNPYGNPLFSGSHPEWDYAEQVTRAALRDLMNVTHTLEDAIFNPPPPLQIQDEDQGRTEYGDSTDEEF